MKVGPNFNSLKDFVVQSPTQDAQFVSTFAKTGETIIQNALDVYKNPQHSSADADNSVADLRDLERATRALMDKTDGARSGNWARTLADIAGLNNGGSVPIGPGNVMTLKAAAEEKLTNAQNITNSYNPHTIVNGRRVWSKEVASAAEPACDKQAGLSKFLVDLHAVTALYATSVAIPGPISASVNSVPETFASGSLQSQSSSEEESSSHSGAASLLLLGGRHSSSQSSGASESSTNASFQYSQTTADLDIVGQFLELQDRLDQAKLAPGTTSTMVGTQHVTEYEDQNVKTGWFNHEMQEKPTYVPYPQEQNKSRNLGQEGYEVDHLTLPTTATGNYVRQ